MQEESDEKFMIVDLAYVARRGVEVRTLSQIDAILAKAKGAQKMSTHKILLSAHEKDACIEIRDLQNKLRSKDPEVKIMLDKYGRGYTWRNEGISTETGQICRRMHFALLKGEDPDLPKKMSGESKCHIDAKWNAQLLIMANKFKVVVLCAHSTHSPLNLQFDDCPWALGRPGLLDAFPVDGMGDGVTVEVEWPWTPLGHEGRPFVLDVALLVNGRLSIAIEVQHSHANSAKKRIWFEKAGVKHAHICSREMARLCADRDWDHNEAQDDVVIRHHPLNARIHHRCGPCINKFRAEMVLALARLAKHQREEEEKAKEQERKEAELAKEQERMREREAPYRTTPQLAERDKYLTGTLRLNSYVSESGWGRCELVDENLKVMFTFKICNYNIRAFFASHNSEVFTVKLDSPKPMGGNRGHFQFNPRVHGKYSQFTKGYNVPVSFEEREAANRKVSAEELKRRMEEYNRKQAEAKNKKPRLPTVPLADHTETLDALERELL
jgi:hypothetical protein